MGTRKPPLRRYSRLVWREKELSMRDARMYGLLFGGPIGQFNFPEAVPAMEELNLHEVAESPTTKPMWVATYYRAERFLAPGEPDWRPAQRTIRSLEEFKRTLLSPGELVDTFRRDWQAYYNEPEAAEA